MPGFLAAARRTEEALENVRQVFGGNAVPFVCDTDLGHVGGGVQGDPDRGIRIGIVHRILDQVEEDLLQHGGIGQHQRGVDLQTLGDRPIGLQGANPGNRAAQRVGDIHDFHVTGREALLQLAQAEQLGREAIEQVALALDRIEQIASRLAVQQLAIFVEPARGGGDRGDGRAKIMRKRG